MRVLINKGGDYTASFLFAKHTTSLMDQWVNRNYILGGLIMSKFKNWWNRPFTRGDVVTNTMWSFVLCGAMYGVIYLVYLVNKWKRAGKILKIKRVSNVNKEID